jgi:3'(2'), 5'-bisphosphate nucleotidase
VTGAPRDGLVEAVRAVAREAAALVMALYGGSFTVESKADASPVTEADLAADAAIREGLARIAAIPIVSEETHPPPFATRRSWDRLWLVDPLDGTRGFVAGSGDFAVNIALIERGAPVLGVVLAPARETCYWAERGRGAFKQAGPCAARPIHVHPHARRPLVVATSRSRRNPRTRAFVRSLGEVRLMRVGSAIKTCLVAEGRADVYPGFSRTSEWDTAAAQVILEEAGGALLDERLEPLRYNARPGLANPVFLAVGDTSFDWGAHLASG